MAFAQGRHTRRRRLIQLACLAVFAALPLLDLLRFDFPGMRLLLFRREIGLDEWALLALALLFAMWLVGAVTLVLGRVYCGYACPQMIFSELAHDIDRLATRATRSFPTRARPGAARAISLSLISLLSLVASALFMAYFAPLREVLHRLARLDTAPWLGAVGASTFAIGVLNLSLVREAFCRTACPYGLLQGVLEDGRSLHVLLEVPRSECIECGACERVCPMGIDIREGAFQIECTRCGSCIDECDRVLGRLRRPGILGFHLGLTRSGFDTKRVLVGAATIGFGAVLAFSAARRETLALHLSPVFSDQRGAAQIAEASYLLRATNRGSRPVSLEVGLEGLPPEAILQGGPKGSLPPGPEQRYTIVVQVPRNLLHSQVTPFAFVFRADGGRRRFAAAFYAPVRRPS